VHKIPLPQLRRAWLPHASLRTLNQIRLDVCDVIRTSERRPSTPSINQLQTFQLHGPFWRPVYPRAHLSTTELHRRRKHGWTWNYVCGPWCVAVPRWQMATPGEFVKSATTKAIWVIPTPSYYHITINTQLEMRSIKIEVYCRSSWL